MISETEVPDYMKESVEERPSVDDSDVSSFTSVSSIIESSFEDYDDDNDVREDCLSPQFSSNSNGLGIQRRTIIDSPYQNFFINGDGDTCLLKTNKSWQSSYTEVQTSCIGPTSVYFPIKDKSDYGKKVLLSISSPEHVALLEKSNAVKKTVRWGNTTTTTIDNTDCDDEGSLAGLAIESNCSIDSESGNMLSFSEDDKYFDENYKQSGIDSKEDCLCQIFGCAVM